MRRALSLELQNPTVLVMCPQKMYDGHVNFEKKDMLMFQVHNNSNKGLSSVLRTLLFCWANH